MHKNKQQCLNTPRMKHLQIDCFVCCPTTPTLPSPKNQKRQQEKGRGDMKDSYYFYTFRVIFSYEGTQPLWFVGKKEEENAAPDKILMLLLPVSANSRCPQNTHDGKALCNKGNISFLLSRSPRPSGHDRAVHVCGICCTGGKDAAQATRMCSLVTAWATVLSLSKSLPNSIKTQQNLPAHLETMALVFQHSSWSYLHQLRNCSYISTWFLKIYILIPCKTLQWKKKKKA